MQLYNLGHVPWLDSQLIYHALPRIEQEGLILLAPAQPYVCIGYHQDADQEVDLAYCVENDIPVFRREVGGGAVFLDGQQLFYQLVIHRDNPLAAGSKLDFYQRLLAPVVQSYRDLGVDVKYRPVNDIVTAAGRKISGNGVAEIGSYLILVGNLIADFDYETMVRVLLVPDVKFRDKVFNSMRENLTTLKRELGFVPAWDLMIETLVRNYREALGTLTPAVLPMEVRSKVDELAQVFTREDWLLQPGRRILQQRHKKGLERDVKIAGGVNVIRRMHKAPGGLIRTTVEKEEDRLQAVGFSGDFFFHPAELLPELEGRLAGARENEVKGIIEAFYQEKGIESPGVSPADLVAALGIDVSP